MTTTKTDPLTAIIDAFEFVAIDEDAKVAVSRTKPEHVELVKAARERLEDIEVALDATLLAYARSEAAGDGGSVDWDDLGEAFELAKKLRPGKYEALVREMGGE
jgi:hypothetical protein